MFKEHLNYHNSIKNALKTYQQHNLNGTVQFNELIRQKLPGF